MVYKCVACDQHYCDACDGGEDSCSDCHEGPLCNECAIEHTDMHREETNTLDDLDEDPIDDDYDPNDDYRK